METAVVCRIFPDGIGGMYANLFPRGDGLSAFRMCYHSVVIIAVSVPYAKNPNSAADLSDLFFWSITAAAQHHVSYRISLAQGKINTQSTISTEYISLSF